MPASKKTVREVIIAAMKRRLDNAAVQAAVVKAHPHSGITLYTVNWYRNRLRKEHPAIPTQADALRNGRRK